MRISRVLMFIAIACGIALSGLPFVTGGTSEQNLMMAAAWADDDDDDGGDDDDGDDDDDDNDDGGRYDDDGDFGGTLGFFRQARRQDRDPSREILAVNADAQTIRGLEAAGFVERDRRTLTSLQVSISRLTIPSSLSLSSALARARQIAPATAYEPNPVYALAEGSGHIQSIAQVPCTGSDCYVFDLVGWPSNSQACGYGLRIGMTDTAVDPNHPALRGQQLRRRRFVPDESMDPSPSDHGTAVAALLVGNPASGYAGMLPSATLFAADVFHIDRNGQPQATLVDLVNGLDWLAGQDVSAINISMTGPPNRLLESAVEMLDRRGIGVVAAAGNGGPAAAPAFPAAYESVISVTAVDQDLRAYRMANRGDYIAFASPGVAVWSAAEDGAGRYRTGTSVAAAHVSAAIAEVMGNGDGDLAATLQALRRGARDLGAPGHDPVFGWGLIQTSPSCGP